MLVLSRKKGEAIIIGDDVVVRVIDVRGEQVRIGVDAPRSVSVFREEIHAQIVAENAAAAASTDLSSPLLAARRKPIPPPPTSPPPPRPARD